MQSKIVVGNISKNVAEALSLDVKPGTPIYIAESNITHIRETHTETYIKYFDRLSDIIKYPDYIGIAGVYAPSIEYIKKFEIEGELVNIAVRATKKGIYYLRSMFIIDEGRLNDYLSKGCLVKT